MKKDQSRKSLKGRLISCIAIVYFVATVVSLGGIFISNNQADAATFYQYDNTWDVPGTYEVEIPADATNITVTVVGGGGGGGGSVMSQTQYLETLERLFATGGGGGSGYVTTSNGTSGLNIGGTNTIVVGSGGTYGNCVNAAYSSAVVSNGTAGEASYIGSISANGGTGGGAGSLDGDITIAGIGGLGNNNGTDGNIYFRAAGDSTFINAFGGIGGNGYGTTNAGRGGGGRSIQYTNGCMFPSWTWTPFNEDDVIGLPGLVHLQYTYGTYDVTLTSVSPTTGSTLGGETITLTGTDLDGTTSIMIGESPCQSFTIISATEVTCVIPPGPAGPVDISLTSHGVTVELSGFTYVEDDGVDGGENGENGGDNPDGGGDIEAPDTSMPLWGSGIMTTTGAIITSFVIVSAVVLKRRFGRTH